MSFIEHFSEVNDPRTQLNLKHDFLDVLFLNAGAVLSGAEGWKDIKEFADEKLGGLRQYRTFDHGIQEVDIIARKLETRTSSS